MKLCDDCFDHLCDACQEAAVAPPPRGVFTPDGRLVHVVMTLCEGAGVEHLVGVAIQKDDKVWILHWPCRHCHVLHMIAQTLGDIGEHEQGFVTNTERFVDREEGARIAFAAGQVTTELSSLFSEHLW